MSSITEHSRFRLLGDDEFCDITRLSSVRKIVPNRNVNLMGLWKTLQSYQQNVKYKNKSFGLDETIQKPQNKLHMTIMEFNKYLNFNTVFVDPDAGMIDHTAAFFRKLLNKCLYRLRRLTII